MQLEGHMRVQHAFVLRMVIVEEQLPTQQAKTFLPTGASRVMRCELPVELTEKAGLNVTRDVGETLPSYEYATGTPPLYED
jgi:hypothetical protein